MDAVTYIPCYCRFGCSGVDDAFVPCNRYFYVAFIEAAPEFLKEFCDGLFPYFRDVLANVEVFFKECLISFWVNGNFDEFGVTVMIG